MVKPKQTLEAYKIQLLGNLKAVQEQKAAHIVREIEIKAQIELVDGLLAKLYFKKEDRKQT